MILLVRFNGGGDILFYFFPYHKIHGNKQKE